MKTISVLFATLVYSVAGLAEGYNGAFIKDLAIADNVLANYSWLYFAGILLALYIVIKLVGREEKTDLVIKGMLKER